MPKNNQTHGVRQRPVSCRFCRSRKLRCDREEPCSNCVSRGIDCEREYPAGSSPRIIGASEAKLIERIRKLEELLENQKSPQAEVEKQHSESYDIHAQPEHRSSLRPQNDHLDKDVAWLESIYSTKSISVNIIHHQQEPKSDNHCAGQDTI